MLEGKGSAKGSCVGALSVNSPEVWMVQAAICLTGAMYTGLHPLGSVDDHVELCQDAEVDILIVHPKFADVGARSSRGPPTSSICSRWARRTSARICWRCAPGCAGNTHPR